MVGRVSWCCWRLPNVAQQLRRNTGSWQVSSNGRLRNSLGEVTHGSLKCSGYRSVQIDRKFYYVHRLVAATFLGTPADASCWQVNHRDGDRQNNAVSNLQYMTPAQNVKHSWQTISSRSNSNLCRAVQWRRQGEASWSLCASQSEAARLFGVHAASISQCCRGLTRTVKGCGDDGRHEFREVPAEADKLLDEDWRPADQHGTLAILTPRLPT